MSIIPTAIKQQLLDYQDLSYREFQIKLIPTVNPDTIIGIRTPVLRQHAKNLYQANPSGCLAFLAELPHQYHEENNLHGFFIEQMKDFQMALQRTEDFLPYIDNWATCDVFSPKIFKKYPQPVYCKIKEWIKRPETYAIRYAIGLLLSNYLDDEFEPEMLDLVAAVKSEQYYVKMMVAWYYATALAKQYSPTIRYLEQQRLEPWTHNKTIQKAIESRRISDSQKAYLRSLKIKSETASKPKK